MIGSFCGALRCMDLTYSNKLEQLWTCCLTGSYKYYGYEKLLCKLE